MGAIAAVTLGFSMAVAPAPAFADYLKAGPNNTYEIVRSDLTAPVMPARTALENADQIRGLDAPGGLSDADLNQFPLFQKFWNELTNVGEFEIAPSHLAKILEYTSTHNLHGEALPVIRIDGPQGAPMVTEGNRALIRHLLQHPYYGAFFEQEVRPMLEAAFGLPLEAVGVRGDNHPVDLGDIDLSTIPAWQGTNYAGNAVATLHQDVQSEFRLNQGWYDGGTKEESAQRLTAMILHFGRAIHMHQQVDTTAGAMDAVSEAFHRLPIFQGDGERARFLREFFARDMNGSGMGIAEAIIRGFDPSAMRVAFPEASNKTESTTSLSMSASSYPDALRLIDEYRSAMGLNAGAVDRFQLSVFNQVIGGVQGNNKTNLTEKTPFASLINFGIVLEFGSQGNFARDTQASQLRPKPGFEFPVDAITATGVAVSGHGATLRVYQQNADGRAGARLSVEKVVHNDQNGQPQYWSAIFRDASGAEVAPDKVIGLLERGGRPLGDGLANQTLASGFWGYCDLNTGQTILGAMHRIPALDVAGPVFVMAGDKLIEVPKEIAQQIVNFGVADSGPRTQWAGFRHDRDAQEVRWLRGSTIITDWGTLQGFELDPSNSPRAALQWGVGDELKIDFTRPGSPRMLGSIRIQTSSGVELLDASKVNRIIRSGADEVTVIYNSSWNRTGTLLTPISLDWSQGVATASGNQNEGGKTVNMAAGDTLESIYRQHAQPIGVTMDAFRQANAELFASATTLAVGTPVKIPQLVIQNDQANPWVGELVLKTVRGTEEIIRADQLQYVKGESEHDIRFSYFMRYVINSGGIYATDASTGASVSNGARFVNNIDLQVERGGGRPSWAKNEVLRGVHGPLVRQPGDHVVFAAGTSGEHNTTSWKGWYQVNDRGQVVNEGWISGMPDTAWGATGPLNWQSQSSFVSELPWEMRVKLFVNGRQELRDNTPEGAALAQRLNLPSNWREYITPAERIPAPPVQEPQQPQQPLALTPQQPGGNP